MNKQGWDSAEFSCGRCPHRFTATTEAEYVRQYADHMATHQPTPKTASAEEAGMSAETLRYLADVLERISLPRMTVKQLCAEFRRAARRIEEGATRG